jgi:hypothetical protein
MLVPSSFLVTLLCINNYPAASPNTPTWQSSNPRVIARLWGDGSNDFSLRMTDVGLSPNTIESVVSFDGQSGFWISSAPVQTLYGASPSPIPAGPSSGTGIRYFVPGPGVNTSTPLYNAFPVKALTLFNNQLWAAKMATGPAGDPS